MSVGQATLAEYGGGGTSHALAIRVGHRQPFGIQIIVGSTIALVYLAATGASIGSLTTLSAAAAAAIALVWPAAGLAALVLILPMREPDLLQPVYIDAVLLGATALGCLMIRAPGSGRPRRLHPILVLAAGYGIYSALGVLPMVSGHPASWAPSAALQAIRILSAVGIFVVASYLFRWVPPKPILAVALIGGLLAATIALLSFWRIGPVEYLSGLLVPPDTTGLLIPEVQVDRASGGFATANYLGFFASQYALLALGMWSITSTRYRPLLMLAIAVLVTTLIVSFSRSAFLGTAAGLVVLAALSSPRRAIALVIVAGIGAAILYPVFLDARLNGGDAFDPSAIAQRAQSENWRRLAADAGVAMFLTQPLFGVGFGVFQHISPAYIGASPATASHNAYVQILAEQGIVGVVMVAGIVIALAWKLIKSTNPLRGAALAMLCAYLVQSAFINSTQSIQISGITWLAMAAALVAARSLPVTVKQEN